MVAFEFRTHPIKTALRISSTIINPYLIWKLKMQARNPNVGETTWLFVLLILFVCAQAVDAAKCNHCGRSGFVQQSRLLKQPQDRVMNRSDDNTPIATDNNYIKCACGKKCEGRRGLTMHQRSTYFIKTAK